MRTSGRTALLAEPNLHRAGPGRIKLIKGGGKCSGTGNSGELIVPKGQRSSFRDPFGLEILFKLSIWISEQGEVPFTLIEDEPMKMEASVTFYWLF